jgi:hypothetical protein
VAASAGGRAVGAVNPINRCAQVVIKPEEVAKFQKRQPKLARDKIAKLTCPLAMQAEDCLQAYWGRLVTPSGWHAGRYVGARTSISANDA